MSLVPDSPRRPGLEGPLVRTYVESVTVSDNLVFRVRYCKETSHYEGGRLLRVETACHEEDVQ